MNLFRLSDNTYQSNTILSKVPMLKVFDDLTKEGTNDGRVSS